MSGSNWTNLHSAIFILVGIQGLETLHIWISIPFFFVYILTLLGNLSLLFIIKTDSRLHEPMYLFFCMLSTADVILCTTSVPKLLSLFWFKDKDIYFEACLTQLFLIYSVSSMSSGFILAMAFDHYVAICKPLRHSAVLTHKVIVGIGLAIVLRGFVFIGPFPVLLKWLPYCRTKIIFHTYCEYMTLIKFAYAPTRVHRTYGLMVAFLTGGLDLKLIICSYVLILYAVFCLPLKAAWLTALGTCGSHVRVILVGYTTAFFPFLTHRFGHHIPFHIHIFVANVYHLVPPMLNPIICGVMSKKIRERFLQILSPPTL